MGKHNAILAEIIEYAREHGSECSIKEMAARLTEAFGRPMTYEQVRAMYKNHHIHSSPVKGRKGASKYPDGMEEYIRSVAEGKPSSEITVLVNERFGEGTITEKAVRAYKKTTRSGRDMTRGSKKATFPIIKGNMCRRPGGWLRRSSKREIVRITRSLSDRKGT